MMLRFLEKYRRPPLPSPQGEGMGRGQGEGGPVAEGLH